MDESELSGLMPSGSSSVSGSADTPFASSPSLSPQHRGLSDWDSDNFFEDSPIYIADSPLPASGETVASSSSPPSAPNSNSNSQPGSLSSSSFSSEQQDSEPDSPLSAINPQLIVRELLSRSARASPSSFNLRPGRQLQRSQTLRRMDRSPVYPLRPEAPRQSRVALMDELVEMELEERRQARREHRREAREARDQDLQAAAPRPEQTVIDLTEEPDSPVQAIRSVPSQAAGPSRNPRRPMSQSHRTPSLTRSDGSLLGNVVAGQVPVIDLTDDDPPQDARHGRRHGGVPQAPNARHAPRRPPQLPDLGFMGLFARIQEINGPWGLLQRHGAGRADLIIDREVQIIGHNPAPAPLRAMDNPLQGNPVQFNYEANGFGGNHRAASPPKPPFVAPPPARDGFTRDTGEDVVAVCASCEEELKYDPDAADGEPPTKKARTRKDREEHHFWAVPTCGHVYCKKCYENRRNTGKKDKSDSLHFRTSGSNKLLCAVDGCESDVTAKKSWIGIFL